MFKKIFPLIGLTLMLTLNACGSAPTPAPAGQYVIGYYPAWAAARHVPVKDIPADRLTHINYAFGVVSALGDCALGDSAADVERVYTADDSVNGKGDSPSAAFHGNFNQLLELKQRHPHLKVLISLGGWNGSSYFSNAARDDASRKKLAASCISLFFEKYEGVFDGLDVDWEYPVSGGQTPGKPEDTKNFTLLLQEFRRQLDELGKADRRHYLLTIAAPVGPSNVRNLDLFGIAQSVDWINLMTYDFHGPWDNVTNFNAPLYRTSTDPADASLNIDTVVQSYLRDVPAEKLVLGIPFYGRGWAGVPATDNGLYQPAAGGSPGTYESGSLDYNDIVKRYLPFYQRTWNAEAYVPSLYNPDKKIFISYDDAQSLQAKAGYARDQGLAGVMIWELSQGDASLLDGIYAGFAAGGPPRPTPAPTVMVPRPFESEIHRVSGIVLDGQLNDWPATPDFILDSESQVIYRATPKSWDGPQDLSAQAWAGWAPEGLYFAFKVVDDVHFQDKADSDLWHGDYMELQFDTQLDEDYSNPGMNGDDYQIGISIGDFAKVPPVAYAWFNGPGSAGPVSQIQMAFTQTADGYILEVFIPKDALSGLTLAEGATFGMNISPSDSDSAAGGQEAMLSTSSIRTYADPRTFGKITLVK